jgi:hypothetical protein
MGSFSGLIGNLAFLDHRFLHVFPDLIFLVETTQVLQRWKADASPLAEISAGGATNHAVAAPDDDRFAVFPLENVLPAIKADATSHALVCVDGGAQSISLRGTPANQGIFSRSLTVMICHRFVFKVV